MSGKKKVLMTSMGEVFGGVEQMELYYLEFLGEKFDIDILVPMESAFDGKMDLIKNGKLYTVGVSYRKSIGKIRYCMELRKRLKSGLYDIVHINSVVIPFSWLVARTAKKCGVKKVVLHIHARQIMSGMKKVVRELLEKRLMRLVDETVACSADVKKNDDTKVIANGIKVEDYKFDKKDREFYRKKLGIKDERVYGCVGRLDAIKNQEFLLKIFKEILKRDEKSFLLLVGDGPDKEKLMELTRELNVFDKVKFLGFCDDVGGVMRAMDALIAPSIKEGFLLVAVEAQANGLMTYVSDGIPEGIELSPFLKRFCLDENASEIADKILSGTKKIDRMTAYKVIENGKCDIRTSCKEMEKIWKNFLD